MDKWTNEPEIIMTKDFTDVKLAKICLNFHDGHEYLHTMQTIWTQSRAEVEGHLVVSGFRRIDKD